VVLDRGRIVEQGRHEDLIAKGGAYYRLHQAQTRQLDPPGGDSTWDGDDEEQA